MKVAKGSIDADDLLERIEDLVLRGGRILEACLTRPADDDLQIPDPRVVGEAFGRLSDAMLADPERLIDRQADYRAQMAALWQMHLRRSMGEEVPPVIEADPRDRRFKDEAWRSDPVFDFLRQSYELTARWLEETVAGVEGLDDATHQKVRFYTRQYVDAIAPTNFVATNPAVLREAAASRGESLYRGFKQLLDDLERGAGRLAITTAPADGCRIGHDVAATPGRVVLQNDLMQLIQYAPMTSRVRRRPLLIVPPWINKYYVLDLRPENSFVRWAVSAGITVFVISWVNPDAGLAGKTFDDYLREGPWAAAAAIERQTGETRLNILGYCLGGTLTAIFLAWLQARRDRRVAAATFLTTMIDFSEPGDLGVFIDDYQLALIERQMTKKGYLEARHMQQVFSLMRANDLIWSFVVNNYLMGRTPLAFDLLHWNADGTRMPAAMHRFYLRNMYQKNLLIHPGGLEIDGTPIDVGKAAVPCYVLATEDDHIAPWRSTYAGARRLGGRVRFVLAGSGHIAGVVNPPASGKYGHRTSDALPADPAAWLEASQERSGSWWPDWLAWLGRRAGGWVDARDPAAGPLTPIEPAPGSYVRVRTS
ncbi:MAG: class I poly(R)-hydroxyalkanoic acid synthase [Geminicoccaceae bacterium]|nr:class I poly(R)-hydroxyalkanoic acid synthase [Geminicoccaceae bacterium]